MKSYIWKIDRTWSLLTSVFRKKPDFIIIGVQKGGTTSLFKYLNEHPQVSLSKAKEVHYYDEKYHKGNLFYKSFFPLIINTKITGESSPYYFFHPYVAERIKKDNPDIKLILMLRNPVERAFSHYQHNVRKRREPIKNFPDAIKLEKERINKDIELLKQNPFHNCYNYRHYSYLARGEYSKQLDRWFRYFNKNQLLIIKSEDFFQNPKNELEKCYNFLGIKRILPQNLNIHNAGSYKKESSDELRNLLKPYLIKENQNLSEMLQDNNMKWNHIFSKKI